ncbi:hypothetical protein [Agrococcus sp. ProA11]|uniref:hypothetical protein n=1 Tax=Agrococcus chionoecetis TaxID=3153752 RepID=UPI0032604086
MTGSVTALGSALIALAVGAGPTLSVGAPWLAVPLLVAGVAQAIISVLALRGKRLATTAVLAVFAIPTLVWVGTLVAPIGQIGGLPLGPMLGETGLALVAAVLLSRQARTTAEPSALPAVLSLLASAAVVAAVATASLAGTEAGRFAVPHGEHGAVHDGDAPASDLPVLDESLLDEHGDH